MISHNPISLRRAILYFSNWVIASIPLRFVMFPAQSAISATVESHFCSNALVKRSNDTETTVQIFSFMLQLTPPRRYSSFSFSWTVCTSSREPLALLSSRIATLRTRSLVNHLDCSRSSADVLPFCSFDTDNARRCEG